MPLSNQARAALAKSVNAVAEQRNRVLWDGPDGEGPLGGVTNSLLGRFLYDRERFRLYVVEGLREKERFNHRIEYGNMIHVCAEATAKGEHWGAALVAYMRGLSARFRDQSNEIDKWYRTCYVQYPIYLKYWSDHPDVVNRKPVAQEGTFDVWYTLPSGRSVRLRGKRDSVDLIDGKLWVQENKARGNVNPDQVQAELPYDLQSLIYLTAAQIDYKDYGAPLGGIRYNIIRRPFGGQKYSIKVRKGLGKAKKGAETLDQFYKRLASVIDADPKYFFYRFKLPVSGAHIARFHQRCLDPILEEFWDWWQWVRIDPHDPWRPRMRTELVPHFMKQGLVTEGAVENRLHYQFPYGVYNPLEGGRATEYDDYLETGDDRRLDRVDTLFSELESDHGPQTNSTSASSSRSSGSPSPSPTPRRQPPKPLRRHP